MKVQLFSAGDIATIWLLEKYGASDDVRALMTRPIRSHKRYMVARRVLQELAGTMIPKEGELKTWWKKATS